MADAFGKIRGFKVTNFPPLPTAGIEPPAPVSNLQFIPMSDEGDLAPIPLEARDVAAIMVTVAAVLVRHAVALASRVSPDHPPGQNPAHVYMDKRPTDADTEKRLRWNEEGLQEPPPER